MATFLDIGILQNISTVFSFLFVFVVAYAFMEAFKFLGEGKAGIRAIFALCLAVMTLLSPNVIKLINTLAPAFVVVMMFLFFLFVIYKMFGVQDDWLSKAVVGEKGAAFYWILILAIIIFLGSFASVYGSKLLSYTQYGNETTINGTTTTDSVSHNIGATFFHPKVLSFFFMMLIAVFAIWLLTEESKG
jgi:hypothetical protein